MYLSRLILNPRSRAVRRDLADCHGLHRTVMSGFPDVSGDGEARAQLGVLYRLDADLRSGAPTLLVQSRVEPDWSRLDGQYLLDTSGHLKNPDTKAVGQAFGLIEPGMTLTFRLRANPTRRIGKSEPGGSRWKGKRVELRDEGARLEWLRRKGEQGGGFELLAVRVRADAPNGLTVPDVRTIQETKQGGRRPNPTGGAGSLTFGSVLFEGQLRVTDADLFLQTLEHGVGSGKAYGFGLLSIAPMR